MERLRHCYSRPIRAATDTVSLDPPVDGRVNVMVIGVTFLSYAPPQG